MDLAKHPIIVVKALMDKYKEDNLVFTFCTYIDGVGGKSEERHSFAVDAKIISDKWLEDQIAKLKKNQEFAITSLVRLNYQEYHIPIIDFKIKEWNKDLFQEIVYHKDVPFYLFKSGSSFHGYLCTLYNSKDWLEYLGKLILLNKRKTIQIVDYDWVGHSLQVGYSTLRWSNNANKIAVPLLEAIEVFK